MIITWFWRDITPLRNKEGFAVVALRQKEYDKPVNPVLVINSVLMWGGREERNKNVDSTVVFTAAMAENTKSRSDVYS